MKQKNTFSFPTRFLSFFIAAQFLNVQIQTAFGTEAIQGQQPEEIRAWVHIKEALSTRLEKMSEEAQYRYAYRLFKVGVKVRNRAYAKSDEEIQEHLQALAHPELFQNSGLHRELSDEDKEIAEAVQAENVLIQDTEVTPRFDPKTIKKEKMIANADAVLVALGATMSENGKLRPVDFQTFQSRAATFDQQADSRAPASVGGVILKVVLCLLVVALGLGIIFVMWVVVVLGAFMGAAVAFSPTWFLILSIATLVGIVFAVRGIILARADRMELPTDRPSVA